MISYNVKNVSAHIYTTYDDKGKKYMIKSRFFLDSKYNDAIAEFSRKLKMMGVIYGEMREDEDANPIDISLSKVSHYIKKIEKPVVEIRKLKLQKLKGVDISSYIFNYEFEMEVLDSYNGKILKELMNEGFPLKTVLRCGDDGKTIKIFTLDVNCYYSEKEERKMKLEKIGL